MEQTETTNPTAQRSRSTHTPSGIKGISWSTALNGNEIYTSSNGKRHDTTQKPPQSCFNCGKMHWRKDCPWHQ